MFEHFSKLNLIDCDTEAKLKKNQFVLPNMDFDKAELQKMTMLYKRFN